MYLRLGINLFVWGSGAIFFSKIVSKLQGHIIYFLYRPVRLFLFYEIWRQTIKKEKNIPLLKDKWPLP